jgi:hypothetical protein
MSVPLQEHHVGGRYLHAKSLAPLTLRYIGPLPGTAVLHPAESSASASAASSSAKARTEDTEDLWLGVEYDDPSRGKHSGTYGDAKLFSTRQEAAGAFVRYKPGVLVRGKTFVQAVEERYGMIHPEVQPPQRSSSSPDPTRGDRVTLGSSGGVIVVQAPGLDAVQRKVGRLERLREMGLEGEWICSVGGDESTRRLLRERLKGASTRRWFI